MPTSTGVYTLPGGNEDNDLWVEQGIDEETGTPIHTSVWDLDDDERATIAAGGTLELIVWGQGHPAVAMTVGPSIEERRS